MTPPSSGSGTRLETRLDWVIGDSIFNPAVRFDDSATGGNLSGTIFCRSLVDPQTEALAEEFRNLRDQWKRDTRHLSVTEDIVMHPAYQRIIGMGSPILPLIIEEMRATPGLWFWALTALTGENPIRQEHYGRLREMTEDWLRWWGNVDHAI